MASEEERRIREAELERLVGELLPRLVGSGKIKAQARLPEGARPDFLVERPDGTAAIIEVKAVTPATRRRLDAAGEQLQHYASMYRKAHSRGPEPQLILVVPDALSDEHRAHLERQSRVRVIDGRELLAAGASGPAAYLLHPRGPHEEPNLGASLIQRLKSIPAGRPAWSEYQKLVGEILAFTLCPPLLSPLSENSNLTGVNRRDFILPNYSLDGFWHYMRTTYSADFIVTDAKNYADKVKKSDILQLGNYLSRHGVGLFGMIVTRTASDRGAEETRREQWALHQKLMIVMNDDDLFQMLTLKTGGREASDVIRQKIEDFRLAF